MAYPSWALLAAPYVRMELPGWGRLLRAVGVFNESKWNSAPRRVIRGKLHGYKMRLHLADWSERQTYFLGRYYDLQTQAFVQAALGEGETFIDVGGNIGMITLLGARLVGETGQVHTFEPNPDAAQRIRDAVSDNDLRHVRLHQVALADKPGELTLSVVTAHSGMGTLAEVDEKDQHLVSTRYRVAVMRGDDVLPADLPGPALMKMDVEGFECRAIRGLSGTIARLRPVISTEVFWYHLHRAGHTVAELFELLLGQGYKAYEMSLRRRGLRHRMELRPLAGPNEQMEADVAWVYPGTVHEQRLGQYMVK